MELATKTEDCVAHAVTSLPPDTAARLTTLVGSLESVGDISELVSVMS